MNFISRDREYGSCMIRGILGCTYVRWRLERAMLEIRYSKTVLGAAILLIAGVLALSPAAAQTCQEIIVCAGETAPAGTPPDCTCEPVVPDPPPGPPTCEANFGCADGNQIGVGEWPNCGCRDLDTPGLKPGGSIPEPDPPGPVDSLGGVDTCNQFFQCQSPYTMLLWNGRCVCGDEMLPPPE